MWVLNLHDVFGSLIDVLKLLATGVLVSVEVTIEVGNISEAPRPIVMGVLSSPWNSDSCATGMGDETWDASHSWLRAADWISSVRQPW